MADMDNQPRQNLSGAEACKMIADIAEQTRTSMFATGLQSFPYDTRPMALQKVEKDGSLWFISSSESDKNVDIEKDDRVALTFQNDGKSRYLALFGKAVIHTDKPTIERYWTNFANAWFDGKDDPRVTIISVHPTSGHYWDTQDGKIVAMAKMSWSALTGSKTDDGGIDGELKP